MSPRSGKLPYQCDLRLTTVGTSGWGEVSAEHRSLAETLSVVLLLAVLAFPVARPRRWPEAVTVAATSALVLGASGPASAGGTTAAVARSTVAAGDVLFWARTNACECYSPFAGYSIVKASAAAPSVVATVLAGSGSPFPSLDFSGPEVSPDGGRLAYVKGILQDSVRTTTLEVRDLATGSTTVLARETDADGNEHLLSEPTWSPNGDTIAYVRQVVVSQSPVEVKVVATSGGPSRTVQDMAFAPAWRPDGKLTVARLDPQGSYVTTGLWITGATPTDSVLIPGSEGAGDHAWSPDGTKVAFAKLDRVGDSTIATLPAAGGTATTIVPFNQKRDSAPAWSSDGQRVYFTQEELFPGGGAPVQIMRVASTGGLVSTVASDGGYNVSPSVTTKVAAPVPSRSDDFNGDGYADVIGRSAASGDLRLYFGNGLALSGFRVIGTGWSSVTAVFSPGDFNGDGHPDVIGRMSNGDLRLYFGTGTGLSGFRVIGTGWGGFSAVFSPGDFNGDGHPDVIGRTSTGDLRLCLGNGTTLLSGFTVIGTRWAGFSAVFSPSDFNGDGHPDVIGRASSTGDLRLYFGTGTTLSGFAVIGIGWSGLSALFSPGDFNLDGKPDVIGRISNGDLRVYYGNGSRLSGYRVIGIGWNGINAIL